MTEKIAAESNYDTEFTEQVIRKIKEQNFKKMKVE